MDPSNNGATQNTQPRGPEDTTPTLAHTTIQLRKTPYSSHRALGFLGQNVGQCRGAFSEQGLCLLALPLEPHLHQLCWKPQLSTERAELTVTTSDTTQRVRKVPQPTTTTNNNWRTCPKWAAESRLFEATLQTGTRPCRQFASGVSAPLGICVAQRETKRHDTTRHDTTRHDTTRHDTTRHETKRNETSSGVRGGSHHARCQEARHCTRTGSPLHAARCHPIPPWLCWSGLGFPAAKQSQPRHPST